VHEELGNFLIRLMSVDLVREKNKREDLTFAFQMYTSCHDKALEEQWLAVGPSEENWKSIDEKKKMNFGARSSKAEVRPRLANDFPRLTPLHSMTNPFTLTLNLLTAPPSLSS